MAFYTLLTNIGKAKLANATALGTTVQLTHIAVGDGNGAAITPVDTATVLTHEVWRAALNSISVDPANANWIVAEGYIPSTSGGFTVREVGLFDIDGDLIALGSYPDTYKPTLAAGSAKDLYIKVIIEVSNSSTVTLKIDPAVVLSTRSYVDSKVIEHEAKTDPHSQYLTAAKINSAIAEDPGDTDLFGFYDSFTGLLRKVSLANLFAIFKNRFDLVYQALLVSGTNIKTINNLSILGSGDLNFSPIVAKYTVTTTAVTSIDIGSSFLDINAHGGSYEIELKLINATASTSSIYIYANGDTVNSNYSAKMLQTDGSTVAGSASSSPLLLSINAGVGAKSGGEVFIHLNNGILMYRSEMLRDDNYWLSIEGKKNAALANVTQLTVTASVANSIGIGSEIIIRRKDV